MKRKCMYLSIFEKIPINIITEVACYFDEITNLTFSRTCKKASEIIGENEIDINKQYMKLKKCCLCKNDHKADYVDRETGMFAHIKCINNTCKTRTLYNSNLINWVIHNKKKINGLNCINLNGFKYIDDVHQFHNKSSVSSVLKSLNYSNWKVYNFQARERRLLELHAWFLNDGHILLNTWKIL